MSGAQLAILSAGCAGKLALALVALRRSARSRLALLLALLFLDVFAWNLATLVFEVSRQPVWTWLDHSTSPLTVPLALEFVLAFVGQERRFARLRILAWIPFILLSLVPTLALFWPGAREWDQAGPWAATLAVCAIAAMTFAIARLVAHLRGAADAHERARTRLLLAAAALGTALGVTDLAGNFFHDLPSLAGFAAQMAHDFKNPLAALKGAAQYLQQDMKTEEAGTRRAAFVDLMLEQIERLEQAIDGYQRLARIELLREEVQLNDLVRRVLALQEFAAGARVSLRAELADGLPSCNLDSGLLANALQNLIRNACEAIDGKGTVTLRTARSGPEELTISVEDTGAGMDARTRGQAFDEFFTTKPAGSGMGLSFVRRVVEAHGGSVSIASELGRGTVVSVRLRVG